MRRGFTLIEVTIALVIFVLAITSILAMYTVAASSYRQANQTAEVRLMARRLLAQVQAANTAAAGPKAANNQVFPDYDGRYTYDLRSQPVAFSSDRIPYAYHVTLTIRLKAPNPGEVGKVLETIETVVLRRLEQ